MTYQRINFKDQNVERPRTYEMFRNPDGSVTFTNSFGNIIQSGTPINAANMNHIEDGIVNMSQEIDDKISTYDATISGKVIEILKTIYPVGCIYLTTTKTCPLSALFGTWTLVEEGRALWTGNGSNGNTTIAAGLPNILGEFASGESGLKPDSGAKIDPGAFYTKTSNVVNGSYANDKYDGNIFGFKASRSNTIYGNSETVQPPAYVINVFRRTA